MKQKQQKMDEAGGNARKDLALPIAAPKYDETDHRLNENSNSTDNIAAIAPSIAASDTATEILPSSLTPFDAFSYYSDDDTRIKLLLGIHEDASLSPSTRRSNDKSRTLVEWRQVTGVHSCRDRKRKSDEDDDGGPKRKTRISFELGFNAMMSYWMLQDEEVIPHDWECK